MDLREAEQLVDAALDEWLHAEDELEQFVVLHSPKGQNVAPSPSVNAEMEKLRKAEQKAFGDHMHALGEWQDVAKEHH
jgi:hypothetical protein